MMNLILPMSARRILYFTAEDRYLYRSAGNALELEARFSGNEAGVSEFRGGLRQCFVDEGRLRFGRLERTSEMAPQALALFVRSETQRLAQYLTTLRVLPRESGALHVLVVAPAGQRALFEQALVSDARLVF